ncbi:MAG: flagellar hook-length control protein FliK, partial [Acetobacterium sp.]|nr:flagellar hook-length control protein FliK [Acetobacterium sp.]
NNTPVVQQVAQKILQNFEPNKPMVLQMTLSPEKLGDIEVQLKYDQGKLVIDIMAASRETQNLLGKQINQLVRGLALQNVQVETVHINTPVEASSTGGNTSSLMNSGSDFSQQQNNAQLRESFLRNSSIQNSLLGNGSESDDEGIISIAQNLQYNGQRRINYYV